MPLTIVLDHHEPRAHPPISHAETYEQFLQQSCPHEYFAGNTQLEFTSFSVNGTNKLYPSSSSFVRSAIEAWARHSHLVRRPDDIWFQILVQLNLYMKKNGESLRDLFVSHEGQQEIEVHGENAEDVICQFHNELQKRVKTTWLSEWISPGFSTTNQGDDLTSVVLMMGLMSTFFEYSDDIICGIPSITLLGTKQDWERLLVKIDRLQDFGEEPRQYERRLRPILTRIVKSFEDPSGDETKAFWDQIVHAKVKHDRTCGLPPLQYTISGWILGFFYWKSTGWANAKFSRGLNAEERPGGLVFDGVQYGAEFLENLPIGYGKVTVKTLKTPGQPEHERGLRWLVAGSIGKAIFDGTPTAYLQQRASRDALDSLSEKGYHESPAQTDKQSSKGPVSALLSCLICFRRRSTTEEKVTKECVHETSTTPSPTPLITQVAGHSTIQPRSGWAIFGPQTDLGPFVDDEEISGPTVDAINSCGNVELYGPAAPEKRKPPTRPFRLSLHL